MAREQNRITKQRFGRALCFLGFHDFQVIEVSFTFGDSGNVEKLQCRRCKRVISRQAK